MKQGFTLIEFLVAMAILMLMVILSVGALNPAAMFARARDAQRKKDLGRIRVAFEEYFNDKGHYPSQTEIDGLSCGSNWAWLSPWPCDQIGVGKTYTIITDSKKFKVFTNLENKVDPQIPPTWYRTSFVVHYGNDSLTRDDINFGVSSSNVSWNDVYLDPTCLSPRKECYKRSPEGSCQAVMGGTTQKIYDAWTNSIDCSVNSNCHVPCCYQGNVCN